MKNKFSLLLATLVVAFTVLCTQPAQADVGTADFGITNSIAAAGTNTTAPTIGSSINVDNVDSVGLQFTGAGSAAGTSDIVIKLARSGDNSNFETTPLITWQFAAAGATTNTYFTNLTSSVLGSAGYLKVVSIGNANASCNITNASLAAVKKKLR